MGFPTGSAKFAVTLEIVLTDVKLGAVGAVVTGPSSHVVMSTYLKRCGEEKDHNKNLLDFIQTNVLLYCNIRQTLPWEADWDHSAATVGKALFPTSPEDHVSLRALHCMPCPDCGDFYSYF